MQEIVTLACEKWAAGDKVGQWKYKSSPHLLVREN